MNPRKVDIVKQISHPIATDVFELIHGVMHRFRASQYRVVRDSPHQLTHAEGKILGFFARNPGSTLSHLMARTGQDKGQLARQITSLKKSGLLVGQEGETDRRQITLTLTSEGREVNDKLENEHKKLEKAAIKGFDANERGILIALLERVRLNLDEED